MQAQDAEHLDQHGRGFELNSFVAQLCDALETLTTPAECAAAAAQRLRSLPSLDVLLTAEQSAGSADGYAQYVLHVSQEPLFSVVALVWRPGQRTAIHDHRCWGAVGVLQGAEHETRYRRCADDNGPHLHAVAETIYLAGDITAFTPPEDVHLVRSSSDTTTISVHVYGADIAALQSSIRQSYPDEDVRP